MSGSGIIWAICKSEPRFRQITPPLIFYRSDALPAAQQQRQSTEGNNLFVTIQCITQYPTSFTLLHYLVK